MATQPNDSAFTGPTDTGYMAGLSKREYFAAQAPPVPDWFIPKLPPEPISPFTQLEETKDMNAVREWNETENLSDLPEHLLWYPKAVEDYYKSHNEWSRLKPIIEFFQWRTFYADQMIEALNQKPAEETKP